MCLRKNEYSSIPRLQKHRYSIYKTCFIYFFLVGIFRSKSSVTRPTSLQQVKTQTQDDIYAAVKRSISHDKFKNLPPKQEQKSPAPPPPKSENIQQSPPPTKPNMNADKFKKIATAAVNSANLSPVTTCPICQGTFNNPKMLPCQHTFCLVCLIGYAQKNREKFLCPTCQKRAVIPDAGMQALPTNKSVQDILDLLSRRSSQEQSNAKSGKKCKVCQVNVTEEPCVHCNQVNFAIISYLKNS